MIVYTDTFFLLVGVLPDERSVTLAVGFNLPEMLTFVEKQLHLFEAPEFICYYIASAGDVMKLPGQPSTTHTSVAPLQ